MDPRTPLATPPITPELVMFRGVYVPFGLEAGIHSPLKFAVPAENRTADMQLHKDEFVLYIASSNKLQPIPGRLMQLKSRVFLVAIYGGMRKPGGVKTYLDVISELKSSVWEDLLLRIPGF